MRWAFFQNTKYVLKWVSKVRLLVTTLITNNLFHCISSLSAILNDKINVYYFCITIFAICPLYKKKTCATYRYTAPWIKYRFCLRFPRNKTMKTLKTSMMKFILQPKNNKKYKLNVAKTIWIHKFIANQSSQKPTTIGSIIIFVFFFL